MQPLSQDELERHRQSFAQNGYVILEGVVPKASLASLRMQILDELDRQQRSGALFDGGGGISGHLNCSPGECARFAYDTLQAAGVVELVKQLSPASFGPVRAGCNINLPNSVAQHYHMDGVFLEDFMIANIAVVDTNLVNGAIDVLPGTHRKFYRFWEYAVGRTYRSSKRLPLKQGDVLVRTSRLWHRGMPNNSSFPRPMLAFTFGEKGFTDGPFGEDIAFQPNWYKPTLVGRLRERTFVSAPITYSAYRFVSSLFNNKGYDS